MTEKPECQLSHRSWKGNGYRRQPRAKYRARLRFAGTLATVYLVCGVHMGRAWRRDPNWEVTEL